MFEKFSKIFLSKKISVFTEFFQEEEVKSLEVCESQLEAVSGGGCKDGSISIEKRNQE